MCRTALWAESLARTFSLPGVVEGHSQVSSADSRAVFFAAINRWSVLLKRCRPRAGGWSRCICTV